MHFGFNGAAEFQAALNNRYKTKFHQSDKLVLSRAALPLKTELWFLGGAF